MKKHAKVHKFLRKRVRMVNKYYHYLQVIEAACVKKREIFSLHPATGRAEGLGALPTWNSESCGFKALPSHLPSVWS